MADTKSLPFNMPMAQAAKKFAAKIPLTRDEFDLLADAEKIRSFTVATVTKAEILQDVMDAAQKALDQGFTLADFNASLGEIMDTRGWTGLTPWHVESVLRTQLQLSYGSGRLEQQREQREDFPAWQFISNEPIDECADLNEKVFSIDDTDWYPPIHINCECHGEPLTQAEAEEIGFDDRSDLPEPIDFAGPGADDYEPDFDGIDSKIAADAQQALDDFNPANVADDD